MDAGLDITQARRAPSRMKATVLVTIRAMTPRAFGLETPRLHVTRAEAIQTPLSARIIVERACEGSTSQALAPLAPLLALATHVAAL